MRRGALPLLRKQIRESRKGGGDHADQAPELADWGGT